MKAAGIERFGGDVRELSLPDPRPAGAGETLITVRAAGVAPWDDLVRLGSWDVGARPPMALGVAAAGTVAAVGAGVDEWSVADEVMTHPVPALLSLLLAQSRTHTATAPLQWKAARRRMGPACRARGSLGEMPGAS